MNILSKRLRSFKFAFDGIITVFGTQPNARIHLAATLLVLFLGFYYVISPTEWAILTIAISLVFVTEFLNTAIESLGDVMTKEENHWIRRAKDVGAGAVLIASIGATIVGLVIFIPKIIT